jgi:hypothetical protein
LKVRSGFAALAALTLPIAACGQDPSAGQGAPPGAWEDVQASDTDAAAGAKRACRGQARRRDIGPTPGGTDPFTDCMKRQADAAFGTPAFEQICSAIPGARADHPARRCMTFDP